MKILNLASPRFHKKKRGMAMKKKERKGKNGQRKLQNKKDSKKSKENGLKKSKKKRKKKDRIKILPWPLEKKPMVKKER